MTLAPAIAAQATAVSMPGPDLSGASSSNPIRKDLQGVGGWLLLFCLGLVVFSPLLTLAQVTKGNTDTLAMVLEFSRVGLGVVVGIFLWNVRPVAFTLLWIYFGVLVLYSVLGIIGFAMSEGLDKPQDLIISARALIYVFVWFLYFRKSERVRATFGRNM